MPAAWADRPSLMQVFLNLMTNSVLALSRKEVRRLLITAKFEGDGILVEVEDTGGGAHPEHPRRV